MSKRKRYLYLNIVGLVCVGFALASCVSQKKVTYFQAGEPGKDKQSIDSCEKYIATIQPGDILSILVSSISPEASAMFNPYLPFSTNITSQQTVQSNSPGPATGYLVNEAGDITIPLIGKLKVAGFTTTEVTGRITAQLNKYLEQPTVNVRILNFKISVLGEVSRPAVYTIPNEQVTLPEAIAMAGDLTIYGKRDNILLIRETAGKKQFNRIDLTKRDVFRSPCYYLKTNDVIYVEPTKSKATARDRSVQLAPMILSGLSLLTVILVNLAK
ncbi:polysaccharide export protein [Pedobacter sp. BS3]|uniref:polysaccharide biosynthesis/export family protein n=1 Tax=Pedobacter sp. BS3 TaxID=2567937 RepID=UPI0011EEF7BC|nr:polysaccharide biosynthesis/export family protein [Pedobacter sp. BS3]TZF84458.1 polysaccharide export protein [Pedobacter sp. BS3]